MAEVFPAGDPRNALYNETLAGIHLSEETSLSGIKESLGRTTAEIGAAEGEQSRIEPGTFRSIDNNADRQGLLESGIETRRTGDQMANFAAKRSARQERLKVAGEGAQRAEETAKKKGEIERHGATDKADSENYTDILNNPSPAYAPAPSSVVSAGTPVPGVSSAPRGPAPPGMEWTPSGGGGWVPKGTKVVRTYK